MPFATNLRPVLLALGLWLCAILPPAPAQTGSRPITEHGLEASLRTGGLKPTELVGIIERRGVAFLLKPEDERLLTAAGATPAILDAVRANYRGPDAHMASPSAPVPPSTPAPPTASRPSTLPSGQGVYVQRGSAWVPLQRESAEYVPAGLSKAFGKASGGLVKLKGDVNGEIAGTHSATTVTSPATFLVHLPVGLSASDLLLVHAHPAHDNREFKISAESLKSRDAIAFRLTDLNGGSFKVEVAQGAGDYAFVDANAAPARTEDDHSTFLYTFQIAP